MDTCSKARPAPILSILALFTLLLVAPFTFAESDAVRTMARIVAELNHYPSAEQKQTLADISQDEGNSDATRAIADAIHNLEHKAQPDDIAALQEVVSSSSASEAEQRLATIVMEINHKASPEAQQELVALTQR